MFSVRISTSLYSLFIFILIGEKWQGPIAEIELCVIQANQNANSEVLLPDFFQLLNAFGPAQFTKETQDEDQSASIQFNIVTPRQTNMG